MEYWERTPFFNFLSRPFFIDLNSWRLGFEEEFRRPVGFPEDILPVGLGDGPHIMFTCH